MSEIIRAARGAATGHYTISQGVQDRLRGRRWTRRNKEVFSDETHAMYVNMINRVLSLEVSKGNLSSDQDQFDAAARSLSFNMERDTITYEAPVYRNGVLQINEKEVTVVDLRTITNRATNLALDAFYRQGSLAYSNGANETLYEVKRDQTRIKRAAKGNPEGCKPLERGQKGALSDLPKSKEEVNQAIGQVHLHLKPHEKRKAVTRQCFVDYFKKKFGMKVTHKTLRAQRAFFSQATPVILRKKQRILDDRTEKVEAQRKEVEALDTQIDELEKKKAPQNTLIEGSKKEIDNLNKEMSELPEGHTQEQVDAITDKITKEKEKIARAEVENKKIDEKITDLQGKKKLAEQELGFKQREYQHAFSEVEQCHMMQKAMAVVGNLPALLGGIGSKVQLCRQEIGEKDKGIEKEIQDKIAEIRAKKGEIKVKEEELKNKKAKIADCDPIGVDINFLRSEATKLEQDVGQIKRELQNLEKEKSALEERKAELEREIEVLKECANALMTQDQDKIQDALKNLNTFIDNRVKLFEKNKKAFLLQSKKSRAQYQKLNDELNKAKKAAEKQGIAYKLKALENNQSQKQKEFEKEKEGFKFYSQGLRPGLIGSSVDRLTKQLELYEGWFDDPQPMTRNERERIDPLRLQAHYLQNLHARIHGVDEYVLSTAVALAPSYNSPEKREKAAELIRAQVAKDIQARHQPEIDKERTWKDRINPWENKEQALNFQQPKMVKEKNSNGRKGYVPAKDDEGNVIMRPMTSEDIRKQNYSKDKATEYEKQLRYIEDAAGLVYQDRVSYGEYCKGAKRKEAREGVEDILLREAIFFEKVKGRNGEYNGERLTSSSLLLDKEFKPEDALIKELEEDLNEVARTANVAIEQIDELELGENLSKNEEQVARNIQEVARLRKEKIDWDAVASPTVQQRALDAVDSGLNLVDRVERHIVDRVDAVYRTVLSPVDGIIRQGVDTLEDVLSIPPSIAGYGERHASGVMKLIVSLVRKGVSVPRDTVKEVRSITPAPGDLFGIGRQFVSEGLPIAGQLISSQLSSVENRALQPLGKPFRIFAIPAALACLGLESAGYIPPGTVMSVASTGGTIALTRHKLGTLWNQIKNNPTLVGLGLSSVGLACVESRWIGEEEAPTYQMMVTNPMLFAAMIATVNHLYAAASKKLVGPEIEHAVEGDSQTRALVASETRERKLKKYGLNALSMATMASLYYLMIAQDPAAQFEDQNQCQDNSLAIATAMAMTAMQQILSYVWENPMYSGLGAKAVGGVLSLDSGLLSKGVEALKQKPVLGKVFSGVEKTGKFAVKYVPCSARAGRAMRKIISSAPTLARGVAKVTGDIASISGMTGFLNGIWSHGKGLYDSYTASTPVGDQFCREFEQPCEPCAPKYRVGGGPMIEVIEDGAIEQACRPCAPIHRINATTSLVGPGLDQLD